MASRHAKGHPLAVLSINEKLNKVYFTKKKKKKPHTHTQIQTMGVTIR